MEENGKSGEAMTLFLDAWSQAEDDLEKFLSAYYIARLQPHWSDRLRWLETALEMALKIDDDSVTSAFPFLYTQIAQCYASSGHIQKSQENAVKAVLYQDEPSDKGPFYHGTKADLKAGDLLVAGRNSNYQPDVVMKHIYFTAVANGAGLAAALAAGTSPDRVYIVEPTGKFEHDPNVTDKKFPGNPTRSYRSVHPLKVVGEITEWKRLSAEQLQAWKDKLAKNTGSIIN